MPEIKDKTLQKDNNDHIKDFFDNGIDIVLVSNHEKFIKGYNYEILYKKLSEIKELTGLEFGLLNFSVDFSGMKVEDQQPFFDLRKDENQNIIYEPRYKPR